MRTTCLMVALLTLALGCTAAASVDAQSAPPSQAAGENREGHDEACKSCEPATAYACSFDSDCAVCHDGSNCGTVTSAAEVARRGADCEQEDAAECEYTAPRCCDGRCQRCSF